jgi:ferredoxin
MALEVIIDPDLCIGSGDCVRAVPGAFRLHDAAGVSVPTAEAPAADREAILRAAHGCPTQAIRVAEGGTVLHQSNGQ